MESRKTGIFGNIDGWLLFFYFFLVIFGWLNIYSSSITEESREVFNFTTSHGKQLIWMGICFFFCLLIMLFDSRIYSGLWFVFYGLAILFLILVLIIGQEVDGNKSWIKITESVKLQPSEFAKIAAGLGLAFVIGKKEFTFSKFKNWVWAFGIILFPALLIILEGDTGTTIVFSALVLAMFRFGLPWFLFLIAVFFVFVFFGSILIKEWIMIVIIAVISLLAFFYIRQYKSFLFSVIVAIIFGITFSALSFGVDKYLGTAEGRKVIIEKGILKKHHVTRIMVLCGIEKDRKGAGWNVYNSKLAIGSGGFWGKGFLKGSLTKLKYIPKQRTDFIFCTVGEEWGFWGASAIMLVYLAFLIRLVQAADRQRSKFSMVYGYAVACIMFFHFLMNIGTTIGLAPAVGVPLPFFSYGGSSLLGFTLLLWIFIKMDSQNMQILR